MSTPERPTGCPADLPDRWRSKAVELRRYGAEEAAATLERCADELEEEWQIWQEEPLTVAEAAEESGYSEERLRELVREGKLPDNRPAGSQGPIMLPRSCLPKRPADTKTDRILDEFVAELDR